MVDLRPGRIAWERLIFIKCSFVHAEYQKVVELTNNKISSKTIHINEAISLVLMRALLEFSINFQVTITFLVIWLVDAAQLSGHSYWLPSNYIIFSKWRLSKYKAIMNDDIGKFG